MGKEPSTSWSKNNTGDYFRNDSTRSSRSRKERLELPQYIVYG